MEDQNESVTPAHASAVLVSQEYRNLLAVQVDETAAARLRCLQLEQELKAVRAEADALRQVAEDVQPSEHVEPKGQDADKG